MKKLNVTILVLLLFQMGLLFAQDKPILANNRDKVDLTIYNQNLSLIREERTITLPKGFSRVVLPEIPSTIDGTSLHFLSITSPTSVRILEQNYQYDLVSQEKLLSKYIGKQVEFVRLDQETKKTYSVFGKLLSTAGGMVVEIDNKIEMSPVGNLILPSLPEGLILKPQLEWLITNDKQGEHKTEISYLAGQLSWTCDYVALLNQNDTKLDLTGWVTLTNNSGTSFKEAGLKLVAGDVNIVRQEFNRAIPMGKAMTLDAAEPQFTQSELFEYKLYTLQRRTDLNDNETKQIELTSGRDVTAKKVFIYDGLGDQWRYWYKNYNYRNQSSFGQQSNNKVGVFVTFNNDEKAGLGIPLPKGRIRVYKRDDDGKEQFVGEDNIDHTPKNEEIKLYLGNAFDIVGERAQTDFKSYAQGRVVEETITIKLRNHKTETAEVMVYEHPWRWSEWSIQKANIDWVKVDQSTIKFPVTIAKDEEKVITYTIKYEW